MGRRANGASREGQGCLHLQCASGCPGSAFSHVSASQLFLNCRKKHILSPRPVTHTIEREASWICTHIMSNACSVLFCSILFYSILFQPILFFHLKSTSHGAPGWLSWLRVQPLISVQVMISQLVGSSPTLGSALTMGSLLGILSLLSLSLFLLCSLSLSQNK